MRGVVLYVRVGEGGGRHQGGREGGRRAGETTILKNLGGIESGDGLLLLLFAVFGGAVVQKGKHCSFSLQCEIYCDKGISENLLLERGKGVYKIIST